MEQPVVVAGNFALSFSLNFLRIFVISKAPFGRSLRSGHHWKDLFLLQKLSVIRWCQFWSKVMASEVEERPRFVTGGYGQHRNQWVNYMSWLAITSSSLSYLLSCFSFCRLNHSITCISLHLKWSYQVHVSFSSNNFGYQIFIKQWLLLNSFLKQIDQSLNHSMNRSVGRSVRQAVSQSISQSVSQSVNQSINQSINQSMCTDYPIKSQRWFFLISDWLVWL